MIEEKFDIKFDQEGYPQEFEKFNQGYLENAHSVEVLSFIEKLQPHTSHMYGVTEWDENEEEILGQWTATEFYNIFHKDKTA